MAKRPRNCVCKHFFFSFAKSNACFCRFWFLFLFLFGVQYCLLSVQRTEAFSLCPLQYTGRGSENCQRWDWEYLFNEYGGNGWCWDICQREKFKYMHIILCHRNLYYDGFFLNSILCRCFIHELFCRNSVGSYFTSPQLNMLWFHFFLLNRSLYRQHYFWDVDTCCRPRTQLFVKYNDCWRQLNSHESVHRYQKHSLTVQENAVFDTYSNTMVLL